MRLPPTLTTPKMNDAVLAIVTEFAHSRKYAVYERDRSRILLYSY
jgi:hypothetical protein